MTDDRVALYAALHRLADAAFDVFVAAMPATSAPPNAPVEIAAADPAPAPPPAPSSSKLIMKCRKCGALGFNARSCGKTHNTSTTPATADAVPSTPSVKPARSPASSSSSTQSPPPLSAPSTGCPLARGHRGRDGTPTCRRTFHRPGGRRSSTAARSCSPRAS